MTFHYWGDDWTGWKDLHIAIDYIQTELYKARICVCNCKEKYGSFRDYSEFWDGRLLGLIHPGYYGRLMYKHEWFYYIDKYICEPFFKYTGIKWLVLKYQHHVYNRTILNAITKWPNVKDELLSDLMHYDLIKWDHNLESKYWVTTEQIKE